MDKTNAMRILDKQKIQYEVKTYDVSDGHIDGLSVCQKCMIDPKMTYKTLVTQGNDHNYYVFVVNVADELDLKKCAKAVKVKSVEMIHVKDINKITGYIRGGCSPIGMKKAFVTTYDQSIMECVKVYVSAGKLGMQIQLDKDDLIALTKGNVADIKA
ncbi:MAG: Cys-tRNA(Pro) deacylase [Erysipelotrichaceae bacterium]|nr:Cys-tRNA(Pro) deacylase [Erysipelotrichaceae bacterium]MDY5251906.1 Cys-tRNA(Pro) deacylase [Erysipelotrichaceae bacterium]